MTEPICPVSVTASILEVIREKLGQVSESLAFPALISEQLWQCLNPPLPPADLGKYSSLSSRMSFQNWPWYCFIRA